MRKFESFFIKIANFRSDMRNPANSQSVKDLIGDSTNNNRTVTVNQVVRYLDRTGKRRLSRQLNQVHLNFLIGIKGHRGNRTDAVDIEEFVKYYRLNVMNNKTLRKYASTILRSTK